jgi:uncharacterized protein
MDKQIERRIVTRTLERLSATPALIQILIGPRQVGKTTVAQEIGVRWDGPVRHATADVPLPPGPEWVANEWNLARRDAGSGRALLVLDEVQKARGWSAVVKSCWDEDRAAGRKIRVLLTGSSSLLLTRIDAENLSGRFLIDRCLHWTWPECRDAFGWDLDRWIFFGGYPRAASLAGDELAWRSFVLESLIETALARDVLSVQAVAKPTLLRHVFGFTASHPAEVISYNRMLKELRDAGNTTTLANYLRLLASTFLVTGMERYAGGESRTRSSSPKLVAWNNALASALRLRSFEETRTDPEAWGRLLENAVGAHLLNHLQGLPYEVGYWKDRHDEIDFVVRSPRGVWAIEVNSGRPGKASGLSAFLRRYRRARTLIVGTGGLAFDEFCTLDPSALLVTSRTK